MESLLQSRWLAFCTDLAVDWGGERGVKLVCLEMCDCKQVTFCVPVISAPDRTCFVCTRTVTLPISTSISTSAKQRAKVDSSGSLWPPVMTVKFWFPRSFQGSSALVVWFFFSKLSGPPADPVAQGGVWISSKGSSRASLCPQRTVSLDKWLVILIRRESAPQTPSGSPLLPELPRPETKIPEYEIWGPKEAVFLTKKKRRFDSILLKTAKHEMIPWKLCVERESRPFSFLPASYKSWEIVRRHFKVKLTSTLKANCLKSFPCVQGLQCLSRSKWNS